MCNIQKAVVASRSFKLFVAGGFHGFSHLAIVYLFNALADSNASYISLIASWPSKELYEYANLPFCNSSLVQGSNLIQTNFVHIRRAVS